MVDTGGNVFVKVVFNAGVVFVNVVFNVKLISNEWSLLR